MDVAGVSAWGFLLAARGGPLTITPVPDGMLLALHFLIHWPALDRATKARLCRCGASANKPFCDGSHRRVGFKS